MSTKFSYKTQAIIDTCDFYADNGIDPEVAKQLCIASVIKAIVKVTGIENFDPPRKPDHLESEWLTDGKCIRNADIYSELVSIINELEKRNYEKTT